VRNGALREVQGVGKQTVIAIVQVHAQFIIVLLTFFDYCNLLQDLLKELVLGACCFKTG
jgi:hypothetical protein